MRLLLFLFLAAPVLAQPASDVWISAAPGTILAARGESHESLYGAVAVHAAQGPWTARLAYSESAVFRIEGGGEGFFQGGPNVAPSDPRASDPAMFRTLLVAAGPRTSSGAASLAVQLGPAWTHGQRRDGSGYADLGVGGASQAMVQLGGSAVWLGAELSGVLNASSSHVGIGGLIRIDLARAPR